MEFDPTVIALTLLVFAGLLAFAAHQKYGWPGTAAVGGFFVALLALAIRRKAEPPKAPAAVEPTESQLATVEAAQETLDALYVERETLRLAVEDEAEAMRLVEEHLARHR